MKRRSSQLKYKTAPARLTGAVFTTHRDKVFAAD